MIIKLNPLPLIPFVDGVPVEATNQDRIKWIRNGEVLNGTLTKTSNEGNLNLSGVQIQQNVVSVKSDAVLHNDKINEVIDTVNLVVENLGAIGDTTIIETLNRTVADVADLKTESVVDKQGILDNKTAIANTNEQIGVYDPTTDPKHRTIRKDIIFLKGEVGKYAGFNENGDVDPTSTGSGLKYKVMQNALGISIHEGRITKLEDDWALSDVGQLTDEVVDLRNELGLKNMATFESVYVRLNKSQNVQDQLSSSVDKLSSYVGMNLHPDVKIADTVNSLVIKTGELDTDVNSPSGLKVQVTNIITDIGTSSSAGTVKGDIASLKRNIVDIDDLLGEDSTSGLRGEVADIQTDIGTDSTPNTIKGRVLNLENTTRDLMTGLNDVTSTVGNTSTGLVAANVVMGKSLYGDGTSTDPVTKAGVVATVTKLATDVGSSTQGSESGIFKLISDLAARVASLELNKANRSDLDDYITEADADAKYVAKPPALAFSQDLPATASHNVGDNFMIGVTVTGGKAPYTYKWFKDGAETALSDQTTSISFSDAQVSDSGVRKVEVTDADGTVITSTECNVVVTEV